MNQRQVRLYRVFGYYKGNLLTQMFAARRTTCNIGNSSVNCFEHFGVGKGTVELSCCGQLVCVCAIILLRRGWLSKRIESLREKKGLI